MVAWHKCRPFIAAGHGINHGSSRGYGVTTLLLLRKDPTMTHTHVTAPTQFVEANGIRFAYRRFGKDAGVPLLFMQHFGGGMDHWDPAITDGFAEGRPGTSSPA